MRHGWTVAMAAGSGTSSPTGPDGARGAARRSTRRPADPGHDQRRLPAQRSRTPTTCSRTGRSIRRPVGSRSHTAVSGRRRRRARRDLTVRDSRLAPAVIRAKTGASRAKTTAGRRRQLRLARGGFRPGLWYEVTYTTRICPVVGTGLLATRDSFDWLERRRRPRAGHRLHATATASRSADAFCASSFTTA